MKTKPLSLGLASLLALRTATYAQSVSTRSGKLDFELGVPTKETVTKLYDEMDYQRACQLYIWALPLVEFSNLLAILEGTTGSMICFLTCARSSSVETSGLCCVEITTASMRTGLPPAYSTLT